MKKFLSPVVFLAAAILSSCGIDPLVYPPVDDETKDSIDAQTATILMKQGAYAEVTEGKKPDELMKVGIVPAVEQNNGNALSGAVLRAVAIKNDAQRGKVSLPVLLVPFRAGDRSCLMIAPDMNYVSEQGHFDGTLNFMVAPRFYVALIDASDPDSITVEFITWSKRDDKAKKNVPVDPAIKFLEGDGGPVLTKAKDIQKLIAEGKFIKADKRVFVPVKEKK